MLRYESPSIIASQYSAQVAPSFPPVMVRGQASMARESASALSGRAMWRSIISAARRMLAGLAKSPRPVSIMRGAEP